MRTFFTLAFLLTPFLLGACASSGTRSADLSCSKGSRSLAAGFGTAALNQDSGSDAGFAAGVGVIAAGLQALADWAINDADC